MTKTQNPNVTTVKLPDNCPRGRDDCQPLSQIITPDGFVCCGHNSRESRVLDQDRFRLCFKNDETDEMSDNDEYDLHSLISIISQALVLDHLKR